ncbi:16S rRNA (guanine(527)-N(7))-methyltransferase RsmG [Pararobbsia silviterrae]|uniref:Ribosomal RNA small subunit methyltransferase G n=1 Tax=Pararobbsia silviterrae TaxID=1792498 RepID=A0A494Y6Z7_9BURK|nr:16S rRNA (guanine(527)-N(7))-methyltransferase RsmG [Pararobbsia silviterrae]RKP58492.1 16S rRNA (guanine(527)-N(7))-methyltransferase RsmG [Pararobbsia silviterrae]
MTGAAHRAHGAAAETAQLADLLDDGVARLGVELDAEQRRKLVDYVALLGKWNAVYNLTAIRDPRQMMIQHVLDSLAIVPHLSANGVGAREIDVLDVGSGGGLPGSVLAIAHPAWRVTLNDIVQKKSAFQTQVKTALALPNLAVVNGRVERLKPGVDVPRPFEIIVSRAFADLVDFVELSRGVLAPDGRIWAMKGVRPDDEIARLPADAEVLQVIRLNVPALDAERHLIEIRISSHS